MLLYRSEVGFLHVPFDFATSQAAAHDELVRSGNRAETTGHQHGVSVALQNVVELIEVLHQAGWFNVLCEVRWPTELYERGLSER